MKNILMIGTGGTIASEMTSSGLTPELNSKQLLSFVPRIGELCHVDCIQLYSLDSTNIRPAHWLGVARIIQENYDRCDGFVISHGTDTMAYTAAALSYLVQGSPKPIVLTGAQKPIWFDGTDSKRNLTDAFLYACRGCGGVQIVFNGKVILGTRARKTCSKSFQAFSSVNYPDLAVLQDERLLQYIRCASLEPPACVLRHDSTPACRPAQAHPRHAWRTSLLAFMLERYRRAGDRESFGVGGLPDYEGGAGSYDDHPSRRGRARQARRHDHPGAQRGQRPGRLPRRRAAQEHPERLLEAYRHDHRGRRGQAHVDPRPDPRLRRGGAAVLPARGEGYPLRKLNRSRRLS